MKKRRFAHLTAIFGFLLLTGAVEPAHAAKSPKIKAPRSFQAEFTVQEGSNAPQQGTMYFSHGHIRQEITPAAGGPRIVEIIHPTKKTIFQIDSDKHQFRLLPWNPHFALISEGLKRSEKRKLVGMETIDGQECEKYEVTPKDPAIGAFYLWVTKGSDLPVRVATEDSDPAKAFTLQWKNVTPGNQAAVLFDPPLNYQFAK